VAEALEQQPGEPLAETLAHHYLRSGDAAKAVVYLERTGDRAVAMQAHASAESYYRELAQRLEALGLKLEAAHARVKLGILLKNLARYNDALDVLEAAAQTCRAEGDMDGWAQAVADTVASYLRSCKPDEALPYVHAASNDPNADQIPAGRLAHFYIVMSQIYMVTDRHSEHLQAADRAGEFARAAADSQRLAWAQEHRGWALLSDQ
jgi:tetratricopeptide (TPR) repeat protein